MKTVELGHTGESVSALCLGTLPFGTRVPVARAYHIMDRYAEVGGAFLDSANLYSIWSPGARGGESESTIGQWMRERGNRARMFVATKLGFAYQDVSQGLRAAQIISECERSLRRLQTDVIDLYYAHVDDRNTPLEETLGAFQSLVVQGKVRYVGASNYAAWRLAEARLLGELRGWATFCCIQQRYSYLRPKPGARFAGQVAVNDELLDYVRNSGIGLLAYSPLLNGAYTRPDREFSEQYRGPDSEARLEAIRAVAQALGATVTQVVYAWMMHGNPRVIPLMAPTSDQQFDDSIGALDLQLDAAVMSQLDGATG